MKVVSSDDDHAEVDAVAHVDVARVDNRGGQFVDQSVHPHVVHVLFPLVVVQHVKLFFVLSDSFLEQALPTEKFQHFDVVEHLAHESVDLLVQLAVFFP